MCAEGYSTVAWLQHWRSQGNKLCPHDANVTYIQVMGFWVIVGNNEKGGKETKSDGREAPGVLHRVASLRKWLWKVMWTPERRKKNPEKGRTRQTERRVNAKALWQEWVWPAEEGQEPAQLGCSEEWCEGSTEQDHVGHQGPQRGGKDYDHQLYRLPEVGFMNTPLLMSITM